MQGNPNVIFSSPGRVEVDDRPIPTPRDGELLIRTRRTLISTGTELTILQGRFPDNSAWSRYARFPFIPGYCNIGNIIDVGANVCRDWIGKRVASSGWHGGYVTQPVDRAIEVPPDVSDEHAAFFTIAQIVINGVRRAKIQLGESAIIFGLGLLGQLTARFCQLDGARPVIGVDLAEFRLSLLPKHPAYAPLSPEKQDLLKEVHDRTDGRKCDVAFEVTGDPQQIPQQFQSLRKQGRLVVLSSPRDKTNFDFHDLCNAPSFTIIGAHGSSAPSHETPDNPWTNRRNVELFFSLIRAGEIDLEPLISHREPFSNAPALYDQLSRDRSTAMGVVLEW